ncbi:MAG: hypothetical protein NVS3B10_12150 [Polyangiales bacterium]
MPPMNEPTRTEQEAERANREVLRNAAQTFGSRSLRDGTWFVRLVKSHAKKHQATHDPAHWNRVYPGLDAEARAKKVIAGVALHAATAGAIASVGASTGELLSLFTEGLAAPVGVPAAVVSMLIEAAYTARLQIDLMCDLASIYGVPFDADDLGELATLFAVALGLDLGEKKKDAAGEDDEDDDAPKGMFARLIELEEGQIGTRIGRKLIEESVMRNIVPFVGIGISARWNYVGTRKLGAAVKKYIRYRHAIEGAIRSLKVDGLTDASVLVEGAWLLATVDGVASHEEMLAIALLVDALPADRRGALEETLNDDEDGWLERVARVPVSARGQILDALYLLAGTDKVLQPAERRFLRRGGKALGCEIDYPRIEQICRHLARGDVLPESLAPPGSSLGERLAK